MTASFDDVADLVRRRRTNLAVDVGQPVPDAIVESLAELVRWAPNHKRTWPWEIAWVTGDARRRLGEVAADEMAVRGDDPAKVAKTRTKYLRAPGIVVVGCAAGDTALRTAENRDAAAAGVQNLLLGATAAGLASFWSSCPKGANDAVAGLCDFAPDTTVVAMIYLGRPVRDADIPERPPLPVRRITD
jgi:nitroreductase